MNGVFFENKTTRTTRRQQIQIKLDLSFEVVNYLKTLEQWENEGGNTTFSGKDIIGEIDLPVRPGEQFEVTGGHLLLDGKDCYFIAEIHKK